MNIGVPDLAAGASARWRSASDALPSLGRSYSASEQEHYEKYVDGCLNRIDKQMKQVRGTASAQTALDQIVPIVVEIAGVTMDLHEPKIDTLLREGFAKVSGELARWARQIDPEVSMADILQASRNAWTACGLQLLLNRPMALTPAIFGYSMLYPYSDNFLDDEALDRLAKIRFNERFQRRLAGEILEPLSRHESVVFQLIELIESQYSRNRYPGVFGSLLAIHAAQVQSLRQTRGGRFDLERVTIAKGGTSVLADAWLAAGELGSAEAVFAFDWGVLLQLGDDLQDVEDDLRAGSRTLFTEAAGEVAFDRLTSRLLQFGAGVKARMRGLPNCRPELEELLTRSVNVLLIRSAGASARFYSPGYIAELERHSPLRFSYLKNRRRWLDERGAACGMLFELFIESGAAALAC